MKPKVALVKDGFLPAGAENQRGRLSAAAIARCQELVSKGWDIDGFVTTKAVVTGITDDPALPLKVERVKSDPNAVVDIPEPTRDEKSLTAHSTNGKVGMRTVCNNCRRSLTYCLCESPKVWLDHQTEGVVVFKVKR